MTGKRQNLNLELTPDAKEAIEKVRAWNGMTQKELVGRLVSWFGRQDRVIQQVILGQIPEQIAPDVARLMLQRLAAGQPSTGDRLRAADGPAEAESASLVGEIPE